VRPFQGARRAGVSERGHPLSFADGEESYVEVFGGRGETFRTFGGVEKKIGHAFSALGVKRVAADGRLGLYLLYSDRSGSVSWPFSGGRIRAREFYDSSELSLSTFCSGGGRFRAGATLGEAFGWKDGGIRAVQFSGRPVKFLGLSFGYSSLPYDWGVGVGFEGVFKSLYSRFRLETLEGEISLSLPGAMEVKAAGVRSGMRTPEDFRGVPDGHAQVWRADRKGWRLEAEIPAASLPGVARVRVGCGVDAIPGKLSLWYNGSAYMRGHLDVRTRRFFLGVSPEAGTGVPLPSVLYERTDTALDLSRGIADSWAFTPRQIEILGDRTWTFSGTGRLVADTLLFEWGASEGGRFGLSFTRLFPDYRVTIVTRDHFSANPWDMVFGRRRVERDGTRYYDFASVTLGRVFSRGRFVLDLGVCQLVPLRHAEAEAAPGAPTPPSFPRFRFARPENFGGLSLWGRVRYRLD